MRIQILGGVLLGLLLGTGEVWGQPCDGTDQAPEISLGLDGGDLKFEFELLFEDEIWPEWCDENLYHQTADPVPDSAFNFVYFELRNLNYNNGYNRGDGDFDPWPQFDSSLVDYLYDSFYRGLYDFGSIEFGSNSHTVSGKESTGKNAYFASEWNQGLNKVERGKTAFGDLDFPFDAPSMGEYEVTGSLIVGNQSPGAFQGRQFEYGQNTGTWINTTGQPTPAPIQHNGLISGDYEFFVFFSFHPDGPHETFFNSVHQDPAFARFTIVEEGSTFTTTRTESGKTTYIGEEDLNIDAALTIDSGADVVFMVEENNKIVLDGGFKVNSGATFKTYVSDGGSMIQRVIAPPQPQSPFAALGPGLQAQEAPREALTETQGVPTAFALAAAYPNPFNPTTTLQYALKEDVHVSLIIYDVLGREVTRLVDGFHETGFSQATWDGRNSAGAPVPSGTYIYQLIAGDFSQARTMVLLK